MKGNVSVLIFEGGNPVSEIEKMLRDIRHVILLENIARIKRVASAGQIHLLTNYDDLAEKALAAGGVNLHRSNFSGVGFHFGRALQELVNREKMEHVLYLGGAGFPFLRTEDLEEVCLALLNSSPAVYSNNAVSADIVAFTPGSLINLITPPERDNNLVLAFREVAGAGHRLLKACSGFLFDVDTPADLLILADSPQAGPKVREALQRLNLDLSRLQRVKEVLKNGDYDDLLLLGRVGAPVITRINQTCKVRLRVFSEERGMKALGRDTRGEVVSLPGFFLQETGPRRFIQYIESVCKAAILDTRVLMAHLKPDISAGDRYLSDMGRWREMKEPFFREFTRYATCSAIPILLGGHSLVLGGIMTILDELSLIKN